MEKLSNSFLFRLYRTDKKLFVLIVVYCLGVLFFALKQREEFPFLLYGMYSLKENPQESYITYQISVNSKPLIYSNFKDAQTELISSRLAHKAEIFRVRKDIEADAYIHWLSEYAANNQPMQIHRLVWFAGINPMGFLW